MGSNIVVEDRARIRLLERDNQSLRDENARLRCAIEEYKEAKIPFEEGRLKEGRHEWQERYNRLVRAECTLIALAGQKEG